MGVARCVKLPFKHTDSHLRASSKSDWNVFPITTSTITRHQSHDRLVRIKMLSVSKAGRLSSYWALLTSGHWVKVAQTLTELGKVPVQLYRKRLIERSRGHKKSPKHFYGPYITGP